METGDTGVGWRPSASSISWSNMGEGTISTSSPYIFFKSSFCCRTHFFSSFCLSAWSWYWLVPNVTFCVRIGPKRRQELGSSMFVRVFRIYFQRYLQTRSE
ncbi:hypothetical protein ATANTOWER_022094 [Ataeniobius toweri]|uniref:Uncharacterized protein n=1 Tax=Ataeniobius toweri TaxID=208326 RepID=A0ABU7AZL4_9TELE|nr:hypothetical protein [Ataeniobius toweri]